MTLPDLSNLTGPWTIHVCPECGTQNPPMGHEHKADLVAVEVVAAPCWLCGGYGALNDVTRKPVPCMACGKESNGIVLTCVDPLDQAEPGEQRGGLRVINGGLATDEEEGHK